MRSIVVLLDGNFRVADHSPSFIVGIDTTLRTTTDSQTALHWACAGGSLEVIHLLWKAGVKDYRDTDTRGYQALHVAVQNGHFGLVHYLCIREVEVEVRDNENVTPLHWAAIKGHLEIARYLVSRGADPAKQDVRGNTALHWAITMTNFPVANYLANEKAFAHLHKMKDAKGNTPKALVPKDKRIFSAMLQRAEHTRRLSDFASRALWLLAPSAILLVFHLTVRFEFSLLATAIIMGAVLGAFASIIRPTFKPTPSNDTLMIGLFYSHSLMTLFYWLYTSYSYSVEHYGLLYAWSFIIWGSSMICLHCWLVNSDPGTMRVNHSADGKEFIDEIERGMDPASVCSSCMIRKPLRCKHDAVTNRCYARFDHYCVWIFNVVANDNHVPFMIMVLMCAIAHFWALSGYITAFVNFLPKAWTWGDLWVNLGTDFLLTYLMGFQILNGIWETMLFFQQSQMIMSNVTMNEIINWQHYSHFWKGGNAADFENPFDHGFKANIRAFLRQARSKELYHLYSLKKASEV